jgi:hypothetical protein
MMLACLAVLLSAVSALETIARVAQAPNSRVTMDVPEGFAPAGRYAGFEHAAAGASIVVLEVPEAAYDMMAAGFTADGLASRGVTNAVSGKLARTDAHIFMRAEQSTPAGLFDKLFVLFRDGGQTVLVTANVPRKAIEQSTVKLADLEKTLASARVVTERLDKPLYVIGYTGPLKSAGKILGTGQLYTPDGQPAGSSPTKPHTMFILAPSIDKRVILDIGPFAERALQSLPGVVGLEITGTSAVEIAGLTGLRHEGKGMSELDGAPVQVIQYVLTSNEGGYVRIIGIAPESEAAVLMPEFRKMAESLKPGP